MSEIIDESRDYLITANGKAWKKADHKRTYTLYLHNALYVVPKPGGTR